MRQHHSTMGGFVRMRGLPFSAHTRDVVDFLSNEALDTSAIYFSYDSSGRPSGALRPSSLCELMNMLTERVRTHSYVCKAAVCRADALNAMACQMPNLSDQRHRVDHCADRRDLNLPAPDHSPM